VLTRKFTGVASKAALRRKMARDGFSGKRFERWK
jgi:hypothetical protein